MTRISQPIEEGVDAEDTNDYTADTRRVVSGAVSEYVVSFPGRSQYSQAGGGVSACGIAALNCARIVLGLHAAGLGSEQLVRELMSRRLLEDILTPCLRWSSSAHLAVDDIHKAPIFRKSLKIIHMDYGRPTFDYFQKLMSTAAELSKKRSTSSCVIITRPPEIIACFCITHTDSANIYIIFDSHPRPEKHPNGAAFIFKNSIDLVAEYLTDLLRYDERLLSDSTIQWQAQLLAHASGEIFVARDGLRTSEQLAEIALDASLQILSLQARVHELESTNESLERENTRLGDENLALAERLYVKEDEFERLKRTHQKCRQEKSNSSSANDRKVSPSSSASTRSSDARTGSSKGRSTGPASTHARSLTWQLFSGYGKVLVEPGFIDPLAAQLQREFDEEDKQLVQQQRYLAATQPKFFECGVCGERFQEDWVACVTPCGHAYCRPCLQGWAVSKIEEHRYPVLCPICMADRNESAPGELDDSLIQQLGLTERQYDVYSEMQLSLFSTLIHCRKCLEGMFVDKAEYQEAREVVCPLPGCNYAWCKMCSQEIDIGGPKHSCDGSSELNHLMRQRGWKHCPGCQTPAEKMSGCNHMTCMSPGCNAHFCYVCGELIVQSVLRQEIQSAVTRHYARCTLF